MVNNGWEYPFNTNFNPELNYSKLKRIEAKLKTERNYMLLSDYSICLMKLGKPKEALALLCEIYKHYPNDYKIAANIGTAYELNNMPDSALKYIKRDIELNPKDHFSSEWVHVKVLETELALRKDPNYLYKHTVLELSEKQKNDSAIFYQVFYQVDERFPFSPSPNEIMASLFMDLADMMANLKSIEYARAYYHISKDYFGNQSPETPRKIKQMDSLIKNYWSVEPKEFIPGEPRDNHKVQGVNYKKLLGDNNQEHYIVNWSKINTNVATLISMVDFSISPDKIKRQDEKDKDIHLVHETY